VKSFEKDQEKNQPIYDLKDARVFAEGVIEDCLRCEPNVAGPLSVPGMRRLNLARCFLLMTTKR